MKQTNTHITGVPEEERSRSRENIWRIMTKTFPNLMITQTTTTTTTHEYKHPSSTNSWQDELKESHTGTHCNQTVERQRHRILRAARKKWLIIYKGSSIRLSTGLSWETLEVRRQWANIFKALKEKKKNLRQPRTLYLVKLFLKCEGGIKIFPDKQKRSGGAHYQYSCPEKKFFAKESLAGWKDTRE